MGGWHFHLTPRWKGILWPRNTRLRSSRCTQSLLMAADLSRAVLYGSRSNISNIYKWHKNPLSVVLKNEECGFKLNYDTKNVTKSENDVMCRNCFICHLSRSFKACPFPTHSHPPPMSVPLYWIIQKKILFCLPVMEGQPMRWRLQRRRMIACGREHVHCTETPGGTRRSTSVEFLPPRDWKMQCQVGPAAFCGTLSLDHGSINFSSFISNFFITVSGEWRNSSGSCF